MMWKVIRDEKFGCSSYILGDEVSGSGMVVDPLGTIGADEYIMTAQDMALSIDYVVETHVHADHKSSARELADKLGIKVSFGNNVHLNYDFEPLKEGQKISLGSLEVEVMETPGHTPDSVSLVVKDTHRGDEPALVMTGDSLFVGDVGRPDLQDASEEETRKASRDLFKSIKKLMKLPDHTEVYPAHYGASKCGGLFMDKKPSSTIGYEKRYNQLIRTDDEDAFVEKQMKLLKPQPDDAKGIRAANVGVEMEAN